MQLIVDAGFTGIIIVVGFIIALAAQVAGRSTLSTLSTSTTSWAIGLLSLGAISHSLGQRAVRDAVLSCADRDGGVIVAQSSAEASANLLLAGVAALVVVAVVLNSRSRHRRRLWCGKQKRRARARRCRWCVGNGHLAADVVSHP